jgi:hypothetical protein
MLSTGGKGLPRLLVSLGCFCLQSPVKAAGHVDNGFGLIWHAAVSCPQPRGELLPPNCRTLC